MDPGWTSALTPLAGGHSGETFLAEAGTESTVVRIYGARSRQRGPRAPEVDAAVLRLVRGLVPVPEVLEARPGDPEQDVPGLLVTSLVPGERLELVLPDLDDDQLGSVGTSLGILLGRLAHMAMPRTGIFADPSLALTPYPVTLTEFLRESDLAVPGLDQLVDEAEDLLTGITRRCLVHSDFNPKNLLVDRETLEVTAVLDWEFAHAGLPYEDLGNLLRFEPPEPLAAAVLAAYAGFVPDAPGDPRELVALARACDLFALVELASRAGENPVADQALERLIALGAAVGATHRRWLSRSQLDAGVPNAVLY